MSSEKQSRQFLQIDRFFIPRNISDQSEDDNKSESSSNSNSKEVTKKIKKSKKKDKNKDKKSKKDKDKKKKKPKKDKKKKEKKDKKEKSYGHYGIIGKQHFGELRNEFYLWLQEVKGANIENLNPMEEKMKFEDFVEDYNLCQFPHKKYYNLEVWERREIQESDKMDFLKQYSQAQQISVRDDERCLQDKKKNFREMQKVRKIQQAYQTLTEDTKMVDQMNSLKEKRIQMEANYKLGNREKAYEIHQQLHKQTKNKGQNNEDADAYE